MKTVLLWLLIIVLASFSLFGCARTVRLNPATSVLLEYQMDPEEFRAALIRALDRRRYSVESETPGTMVAHYERRGVGLRVQVDYRASDYRISYLGSMGLGHRLAEDGTPVISSRYNRHITQLRRSIDHELDRPAREAQQAIDAERAHQRALVAGVYVSTQPYYGRTYAGQAYYGPASCESLLVQMGHGSMGSIHCRSAEPHCAQALLLAGHRPAQLMHCQGVDPQCAVDTLESGRSPLQLLHCR